MRWLPQMHLPQSIHVPEQYWSRHTCTQKNNNVWHFEASHSDASLHLLQRPTKKSNQMEEKQTKYPELVKQCWETKCWSQTCKSQCIWALKQCLELNKFQWKCLGMLFYFGDPICHTKKCLSLHSPFYFFCSNKHRVCTSSFSNFDTCCCVFCACR